MPARDMPIDLYPESMTCNLEFNSVVHTSSFNAKQQVERRPGDFWTFTFSYKDLEFDEARRLHGFLLGLEGVLGTFNAKDYASFAVMGGMSGVASVVGSDNYGTSCLANVTPKNTLVFLVGDYVKISGNLHMITSDVMSNSIGVATLNFVPPLRVIPVAGSSILYDNFTVECRLKDNKQGRRSTSDMQSSFSFDAIEAKS
jgi:hypothetical protein